MAGPVGTGKRGRLKGGERPGWHYDAVMMAMTGTPIREIALKHGRTASTVQAAIERTLAATHTGPPAQRALWNSRIEAAVKAIWPAVEQGDLQAIRALTALASTAAEMNGLKMGTASAHLVAGQVTIRFENALGEPLAPPPLVIDQASD